MSKRKHNNDLIDQFYTKESIIDEIVLPTIKKFMPPNAFFVDFSCGTNYLIRTLSDYISAFLAYDIDPTEMAKKSGSISSNWFDIKKLETPPEFYIGLNPPFGYRGKTAQQFITHTLNIAKPNYMFLILPIREWKTPNYKEVYKVKLPLNAFVDSNGADFEYPCFLYVFQLCNTTHERIKVIDNGKYLKEQNFKYLTHALVENITTQSIVEKQTTLIIRRVGYYAGRQFYIIENGVIYYYHKQQLHANQTWVDNNHNINNSFWVVYFPFDFVVSVNEMTQICDRMITFMNDNALTTRIEDVKRAVSINKRGLEKMLCDCLYNN